MPATAGRVRMPANNRVHSSAALQTHGIWQSAIGYDPYAPATAKESGSGTRPGSDSSAYASFQGLLALAKITGSNSNETRGACRKCGRVGHLTYQCRNFLVLKDEEKDGDGDRTAIRTAGAIMEKIKKSSGNGNVVPEESSEEEGVPEEEEEVDSSSSDSDVDPEIERVIKKRYGWTLSKNVSFEDEEEERRERRMRRHKRRRRRRESDSETSDESEEESKRSDRHRRKRQRKREEDSLSASDSSYGDRKERKRGEKRSHNRRRH